MPVTLAIDFGSTYTKLVAVDCDAERLVGVVQSPTTVAEDVTHGLERALDLLEATAGVKRSDIGTRVASSSAAGGLRMVAIGLVPDLTAEAARRAALGAGAKVLHVFSYELTGSDQAALRRIAPDMIMLAGGTDGGDRKTIVTNARILARLRLAAPVIVAGNRAAADEASAILTTAGSTVAVADNVLPELGRLAVDGARAEIRRIFMERITHAKGLDRAEAFVGRIVMPTPMAVLEGARLLAEGTARERGFGDLVVVDVGGATTDIHSVASGAPTVAGMVPRGLPEPYAKRTVEGDLGIRVNAPTIMDTGGVDRLQARLPKPVPTDTLVAHVQRLAVELDRVPGEAWEHDVDAALARVAVEVAIDRHAGRVETLYTPNGSVAVLHGKDLSAVRTVIGTGGVFAHGRLGHRILEGVRFDPAEPVSLRPRDPSLFLDSRYILFAVGLLAQHAPEAAIRIFKRHSLSTGASSPGGQR